MSTEVATATAPVAIVPAQGMRASNGTNRNPHSDPRQAMVHMKKRLEERKFMATVKAKEKEMKDEKEAERQRRITALKEKRAVKEEKARYEKLAETMHKKRVERLKRKEKRNKMLKS
ncbi:rRNA-processing protein [Lachnellula occidentalis]|uniref:rRNA-processing protein n=1 Tax=Lachnellula occidentalis TaxID=215460 RepID=A0A8H8UJP3_9HELO|nr:rRNA-processing protein [Lachnellula occidentalis]